ncbi:MAG: hypothetical protein A2086_09065 [Spirochaetes bacterium GWD1_27_9]|nr:MAG: hypothetical protein A2Z98_00875 [Spirochaetes bacterium GWB1_27_13]OHD23932.1 MAG: hypothetical protein A2Y34_17240 [Spirochaetes bacterium GWC1_27_15]OHD29162.1 MAG: hypothetical protein A2086_09065 [Spirochaetes bacterium GWD1_27_9]
MVKKIIFFIFVFMFSICGIMSSEIKWEDEVFYQIFPRSFYDSNGDGIGDLNGIRQKIPYLKELGITTIWLNPLYLASSYHNYFADDFYKIDTEFGTMEDLIELNKELHKNNMKILLDMETHYITGDHLWYKDSYQNPKSPYGKFIKYNGENNTDPESIIWNIKELPTYDGKKIKLMTLNLYDKELLEYQKNLFAYFADPNNDGDFTDGIDGYRMDHIMDNLDDKNIFTGLLKNFWKPIVEQTKKINPNFFYLVEPADWGYGDELLTESNFDSAFAMPFRVAMVHFDKNEIVKSIKLSYSKHQKDKYQFMVIENHDAFPRFATLSNNNKEKIKLGAMLNITAPGIPCLYYGQEIGMNGKKISEEGSDGADIMLRESFEWYKTVKGYGMALWYPERYIKRSFLKDNDGISYEEEKDDPKSIFNYYKKLIWLRKNNNTLKYGDFNDLSTSNKEILAFERNYNNERIVIIINFSDKKQNTKITFKNKPVIDKKNELKDLIYDEKIKYNLFGTNFNINLTPYQSIIVKM